MKNRYSFARVFVRILPIVVRAVPMVYPLSMLAAILSGLGTGFLTTLIQRFFDAAARYATAGGSFAQALRAAGRFQQHDELIARGGLYARMYRAQAKWYI